MMMARAFLIVTLQMLKNRVIAWVKRLRNPRYLLSTIAALAYFWFFVLRRRMQGGGARISIGSLPVTALVTDIASVAFLLLLILIWALPEQSGGLEFSEAEIQFLFAAPLTRTQVLLYKYLRGVPGILISSIVMTCLGFRSARGFGLIFIFAMMSSYFIMVALGRARLKLIGVGAVARIVIVAVVLTGLTWYATTTISAASLRLAARDFARRAPITGAGHLDTVFHGPFMSALLFVPRIFATALLPVDFLHQVVACAALVGFSVLFFFIAARLNVAFEEASIGYSQRRASRRERMQRRQLGTQVDYRHAKPLFQMAEAGRAEVAFIWKNTNSLIRVSSGRTLAVVIPIVLFALLMSQMRMISSGDRLLLSGTLLLATAAIVVLLGPMMLKNDMRLDLPRFEVLKTYPLRGETIIAGEIAAPLMMLSIVQIALIIAGVFCLSLSDTTNVVRSIATPEHAIIAVMFAVPVCAIQLLMHNAAVVFFPAWVQPSKEDMRGPVASGQRLLMLAAHLLFLGLILIPPAIAFVPALIFAQHFFRGSPIAAALVTVPSVAVLVAEIYFALKLLGAQFERIDLSEEK
jgi:hypothetical protein